MGGLGERGTTGSSAASQGTRVPTLRAIARLHRCRLGAAAAALPPHPHLLSGLCQLSTVAVSRAGWTVIAAAYADDSW